MTPDPGAPSGFERRLAVDGPDTAPGALGVLGVVGVALLPVLLGWAWISPLLPSTLPVWAGTLALVGAATAAFVGVTSLRAVAAAAPRSERVVAVVVAPDRIVFETDGPNGPSAFAFDPPEIESIRRQRRLVEYRDADHARAAARWDHDASIDMAEIVVAERAGVPGVFCLRGRHATAIAIELSQLPHRPPVATRLRNGVGLPGRGFGANPAPAAMLAGLGRAVPGLAAVVSAGTLCRVAALGFGLLGG